MMTYDREFDPEAIRAEELEEDRKYDAHVASLKPRFGIWDRTDPVVTAILRLVEAQNVLTTAIDVATASGDEVHEGPGHVDIPAAVEMRAKAALQLMKVMVLGDVWTVQLERRLAEDAVEYRAIQAQEEEEYRSMRALEEEYRAAQAQKAEERRNRSCDS
jgi:hypothetical protein